jgi:hypothetical protein
MENIIENEHTINIPSTNTISINDLNNEYFVGDEEIIYNIYTFKKAYGNITKKYILHPKITLKGFYALYKNIIQCDFNCSDFSIIPGNKYENGEPIDMTSIQKFSTLYPTNVTSFFYVKC